MVTEFRLARDLGPVVALEGVTVQFPGPSPVRALDDISLQVWPNELVAVVGPSGSGKTTLLAVLGGLRSPTSGRLLVNGRQLNGSKQMDHYRRHHVGFVFQTFCLVSSLTTNENVMMGELYRGVSVRQRRAGALRALESVGLGGRRDHPVALLSGGEQQRVSMARALAKNPSVLLADEPTGNLDRAIGQEILEHLVEASLSGASVVVVTHDPQVAERASRVVELVDGKIHQASA